MMATGMSVNPNCGCRKSVSIVMVSGATADETTCLWPGKIAVVDDEATTFCTDPFSEGNDCWLMVVNGNLGSVSTLQPTLRVGEYYLGRPIGVVPTEQEEEDPIDVPIFAIRIEENQVYHITIPSPGVAAGATMTVTLPDGRNVTATNWSVDTKLVTADRALCFKDLTNDTYYLLKTGEATKIFHASPTDTIEGGSSGSVGIVPSGPFVTAENWSGVDVAYGE